MLYWGEKRRKEHKRQEEKQNLAPGSWTPFLYASIGSVDGLRCCLLVVIIAFYSHDLPNFAIFLSYMSFFVLSVSLLRLLCHSRRQPTKYLIYPKALCSFHSSLDLNLSCLGAYPFLSVFPIPGGVRRLLHTSARPQ